MAESDAGAALTEQHRRRQLALRAQTVNELTRIWPAWSVDTPGSFDTFVEAAATLTNARRRESAGLAGGYYEAFRTAEGAEGRSALRMADDLERRQLTAYLRSTGLGSTVRALRSGRSITKAREVGFVEMAGAVSLQMLNGGRDTLLGSVQADRQARGWQRVTAGSPCAFCTMLSGRGPVYKSDTAGFEAHKHCVCTAEPVYGAGWTDQNRAHKDAYDQAQRWAVENGQMPSGTANDQLNALRRFLSA